MQSDGTSVTLAHPAQRLILLSSNAGEIIQILGASDKVVGVTQSIIDNEEIGAMFANAKSTGKWNVPDLETLISLNPDAVIAYSSSKPNNADAIKAAGIPIIYIDCYKPATMSQDVRALGKLVNEEKKADEFANYFEEMINVIESRINTNTTNVAKSTDTLIAAPRVFCEGYTDYSAQRKNSGMDLLLNIVGGENIMIDTDTSSTKTVSAEWLIMQNPDAYIKVATHEKMKGADGIYDELVGRTGFSNMQAITKNKTWVIDSGIAYGPRTFVGALAFAKMLYPEKFSDMSIEGVLNDYNIKYGLKFPVENCVYPAV